MTNTPDAAGQAHTLVRDTLVLTDALEHALDAMRERPETVSTLVVLRMLAWTIAREAVTGDVSLEKLENLVRHEYHQHAAAAGQP
jgi:hypothetical protein